MTKTLPLHLFIQDIIPQKTNVTIVVDNATSRCREEDENRKRRIMKKSKSDIDISDHRKKTSRWVANNSTQNADFRDKAYINSKPLSPLLLPRRKCFPPTKDHTDLCFPPNDHARSA